MLASTLIVFSGSPSPADAQNQVRGYTLLHYDGFHHYACKRWFNTPYGGVFEIRTLTIDRPGGLSRTQQGAGNIVVATKRNGTYFNWKGNTRWWRRLNGQKFFISGPQRDRFWVQVQGYGPTTRSFSPNQIVRCAR